MTHSPHPLRIAFVLPGLHRVCRGAEVALESVAQELSLLPDVEVTLFGSGEARANDRYRFVHIGNISREFFEKFPSFPILRSEVCLGRTHLHPRTSCPLPPI